MSDQHITAIAMIVQDVLLFVSALLVFWYLWETRKMRQAAEKQVSKSQKLVEAAQEQIKVSQDQFKVSQEQFKVSHEQIRISQKQLEFSQEQIRISLQEAEAQITPAVVVWRDRDQTRSLAENMGNGSAINLKFVTTAAHATIQWDASPNVQTMLNGASLPIGKRPSEDVMLELVGGAVDQELQIMYKSLSGKQYFTIMRFGPKGVLETIFGARESAEPSKCVLDIREPA